MYISKDNGQVERTWSYRIVRSHSSPKRSTNDIILSGAVGLLPISMDSKTSSVPSLAPTLMPVTLSTSSAVLTWMAREKGRGRGRMCRPGG
jgi:hypothetical protein